MSELIAGKHPVYHALKAGRRRVEKITISSRLPEADLKLILDLATAKKVKIEKKDLGFISKNSPIETHQGVLAQVAAYPYVALDDLIEDLKKKTVAPLLLLDEIQDPHHLGALIRSATCFGFQGVLIGASHASLVNATAAKSSSGAVEYMAVTQVTSLAKGMDQLKEAGYWIYGAEANSEKNVYNQDFDKKSALVIGNEGRGLRHLVRQKCDFFISIPIVGELDSLSASAAGSIFMAELRRGLPF